MGRVGGGCGGSFHIPPECLCVIGADKDGALPHVKTLGGTFIVENALRQINIIVGDRSPGFVKLHQVCDHVCRKMRSPHSVVQGGRVC